MSKAKKKSKIKDFNPEILVFCCNWCSYAGADLAGVSRFQYPPNMRIVRVMCSGRVDPSFVLKALKDGADGVLITGCHIGDCHYISGNYKMKDRMDVLARIFNKLGLSKQRFRVEYVSAAEGVKFASIMREMTEQLKALGTKKIKAENKKLKPTLDRMLSKKKK